MSYCKEEGKDRIIFMTPEDLSKPSTVTLPEEEEGPGLILPSGEINWECPCLGGMATGPCGTDFREAFSCFHYSQADPKGSDCYEKFKTMTECMQQYPTVYGKDDKEESSEEPEKQNDQAQDGTGISKPEETSLSVKS